MLVSDKICTPNKTSRNSKLFYERKGKFYSCDHYENFSPLNNRINFNIVSNMYFNLMHVMSKTTITISMDTLIKFSWTDNGIWSRNYSFWNLSLNFDTEPEQFSELGAWSLITLRQILAGNLQFILTIHFPWLCPSSVLSQRRFCSRVYSRFPALVSVDQICL